MNEAIYEENGSFLFFPFSFKILPGRIEVFFFPFKYKIDFSNIENIETIERIPWYAGWGLRARFWNRTLYFAIHHGKSIKIRTKSGFWREIIISPKSIDNFLSALRDVFKEVSISARGGPRQPF